MDWRPYSFDRLFVRKFLAPPPFRLCSRGKQVEKIPVTNVKKSEKSQKKSQKSQKKSKNPKNPKKNPKILKKIPTS